MFGLLVSNDTSGLSLMPLRYRHLRQTARATPMRRLYCPRRSAARRKGLPGTVMTWSCLTRPGLPCPARMSLLDGCVRCVGQAVCDGKSPGNGQQENQREAEEEWRRPCGADAEARHGDGGTGAGERLVQAAVAVPGLQACGYQHRRAQHDGGAPAQYPRRGGRGATVVGVIGEAAIAAPIAASTRICNRNVLRARASSCPCSSWWRLPLAHAIHTSVNTTANSPRPRQVRCPARWRAAWATSTTTARS